MALIPWPNPQKNPRQGAYVSYSESVIGDHILVAALADTRYRLLTGFFRNDGAAEETLTFKDSGGNISVGHPIAPSGILKIGFRLTIPDHYEGTIVGSALSVAHSVGGIAIVGEFYYEAAEIP